MKQVLFLVATILIFHGHLCAQPYKLTWQNCYSMEGDDRVQDIIMASGSILMSSTNIVNQGDIWLRKMDENGLLLWEKRLNSSSSSNAKRILPVKDGGFILVGGIATTDDDITSNPYSRSSGYWIVKIDSSANIIWDKVLGNSSRNVVEDGIMTSDSGIVAFGWISGGGGDVTNYYGERDMWVVKTDMNGNKLWDYTIGSSTIDFGLSVIETSDKGLLLGGSSLVEEGIGGNIECKCHGWEPEAIVFKLDSAGNYEWQKCYGGSEIEYIDTMIEVDGGYILGCQGFSDDGDMLNSGYHLGFYHTGARTPDVWLVKIDYNGNIIWQKCYGGSGTEALEKMIQLKNGNIIIFAKTSSFDGDVIGNHSLSEHYFDIWIFEIDSTGNLLWQKCIGGFGDEGLTYNACQKNEQEYIVATSLGGNKTGDVDCSEPVSDMEYEIWVFELADSTLGIQENNNSHYSVYPNPAREYVVIETPQINSGLITIMDMLGRIAERETVTSDRTIIYTKDYEKGLYFFRFNDEKGKNFAGKFVVN